MGGLRRKLMSTVQHSATQHNETSQKVTTHTLSDNIYFVPLLQDACQLKLSNLQHFNFPNKFNRCVLTGTHTVSVKYMTLIWCVNGATYAT